MTRDWLSTAEAAALLGVGVGAVTQMIRCGRLRASRVGGRGDYRLNRLYVGAVAEGRATRKATAPASGEGWDGLLDGPRALADWLDRIEDRDPATTSTHATEGGQ